jgi:predicted nuclease of predicted toxin-antitoxin system
MTHDLDFSAILAASGDSVPSVVQIRSPNVSPQTWGSRIVLLLLEHEALLKRGALITVDTDRNRVRLLPLQMTR